MSELYPPEPLYRALLAATGSWASSEEWLRLAAARGATPREGPLAHDVLVPTPAAPSRVGLNIFGHGSDAAIRRLVLSQAPQCVDFLKRLGAGGMWNAGCYHDASGDRLKLYLTGDLQSALPLWPVGLPACRPAALGVDLGEDGPTRHRVYLLSTDPGCAELEADWNFPEPLPWPCDAPWISHCLLTAGVRTEKRTRNWIFRIDTPLHALRNALPPTHREALDEATATSPGPGLEWGPVALEADSYADGSGSLDWLLTVRRST